MIEVYSGQGKLPFHQQKITKPFVRVICLNPCLAPNTYTKEGFLEVLTKFFDESVRTIDVEDDRLIVSAVIYPDHERKFDEAIHIWKTYGRHPFDQQSFAYIFISDLVNHTMFEIMTAKKLPHEAHFEESVCTQYEFCGKRSFGGYTAAFGTQLLEKLGINTKV